MPITTKLLQNDTNSVYHSNRFKRIFFFSPLPILCSIDDVSVLPSTHTRSCYTRANFNILIDIQFIEQYRKSTKIKLSTNFAVFFPHWLFQQVSAYMRYVICMHRSFRENQIQREERQGIKKWRRIELLRIAEAAFHWFRYYWARDFVWMPKWIRCASKRITK